VIQHRLHACRNCVEKQRQIDRLTKEVARLKARLRYQERTAKEAPFGSATPSAKQLIKASRLAENNRAKRELRPLVIARKLSFGSQSARGLRTRDVLMSILHTLAKRTDDVFARLVQTLNTLAAHPKRRLYPLLFNSS